MVVRDGKVTFRLEDGRVLNMNTSVPQLSLADPGPQRFMRSRAALSTPWSPPWLLPTGA